MIARLILCLSGLLLLPPSGVRADAPFVMIEGKAFGGHNPTMKVPAFDLITSDIDLDGDPDLLINWHHLGPLELFENRDGTYFRVDEGDGSKSGLVENPNVNGLFKNAAAAEAAIATHSKAGLYFWHDKERLGSWQFLWVDPSGRYRGCTVHLTTSVRIENVDGLDADAVRVLDDRRRTLVLSADTKRRRFSVTTDPVGARLEVRLQRLSGREDDPTPVLFAGIPPIAQSGARATVWKPDPHGMAWVDVEGTPHPELFVTRGGLSGQLLPPLAPKTERYYVATDGTPPFRLVTTGIPPSYGRGRSVEWVDIDNDGALELSIANEEGPNQLLVRGADGTYVDHAAALGVALDSATLCWGDADRDGFQDLFYLEPEGVKVLLSRNGTRFSQPVDDRFKMGLPPIKARDEGNLFDRGVLRLADFDADGDLDVWVLGRGRNQRNHLFLRQERGYDDATSRTGFQPLIGSATSVLGDFNNDGYEDMFVLGYKPALWLNRKGERIQSLTMPFVIPTWIEAGGAADVNQDGRIDLVLAGRTRYLLENRLPGSGESIQIGLRDPKGTPIGAVVTAVYTDGRRVARRFGSDRTTFSQRAEPLRFAAAGRNAIRHIEVRWPGDRSATKFEIAPDDSYVVLERTAKTPGVKRGK